MNKVIKIIFSILAALALFLTGWVAHAWKNRGEVTKEVKKAIGDLNKEHKKALEALKDKYEEQLKKKDEIIENLQKIIDRLLILFKKIPGSNAAKVVNNLTTNRERLHKL